MRRRRRGLTTSVAVPQYSLALDGTANAYAYLGTLDVTNIELPSSGAGSDWIIEYRFRQNENALNVHFWDNHATKVSYIYYDPTDTGGKFYIAFQGSAPSIFTGFGGYADGNWHSVKIENRPADDNTKVRVTIDTDVKTVNANLGEFIFGRFGRDNANSLNGGLDHIKITESGVVTHEWLCNEGSGTNVADSVGGSGYDATMQSGVTWSGNVPEE